MSLTYSRYLALDKVLDAQHRRSEDEHDEMLFIIIHQVYELWFKQILHEGAFVRNQLRAGMLMSSVATLERVLKILKVIVSQIDVLETMTPLSFASFRDHLEAASGFQSAQFRLFECFLGLRGPEKSKPFQQDETAYRKIIAAHQEPSIYDELLHFLKNHHHQPIPDKVLQRDPTVRYTPNERVEEVLLDIYRTKPQLRLLLEKYVDIDEGVQEWRYRHVKMVERTIGKKIGTGKSDGAKFLRATLFDPAFSELWNIRDRF